MTAEEDQRNQPGSGGVAVPGGHPDNGEGEDALSAKQSDFVGCTPLAAPPMPAAVTQAQADSWRGAPFKVPEAAGAQAGKPALQEREHAEGERPRLTYTELYEALTPYKPPTKEELEAERRRQQRRMRIAAVSDGIAALSNLFFTSQYAPNMYDPTQGMTARTQARFEQLRREREANQRDYMQGYMRAMALDAQRDGDRWNRKHTLERERVSDQYREAADRRAEARAERDAAMADLKMDLMLGKISQADADARRAEIRADYEEALIQSQIGRNNRSGNGRSGGSSGNGGRGKYKLSYYDENGELQWVYGDSLAEVKEERERLSREAGSWVVDERKEVSEHYDGKGRGNGTTVTNKVVGGHSEPKNRWEHASQIQY